jgi:hypothetical protein
MLDFSGDFGMQCLIDRQKLTEISEEHTASIFRLEGFEPRSAHMGFVVDSGALGQVFYEYFGFPFQFSFHRLLAK